MRSTKEIEKSAPPTMGGLGKCTDALLRIVIEVLLDIRGLLDRRLPAAKR